MKNLYVCSVAVCLSLMASAAGRGASSARTAPLPDAVWAQSEWISAKDAKTLEGDARRGWLAAKGASYFRKKTANAKAVKRVRWMTSGLGVYDIAVNGKRVGEEILRPGFTSARKTRLSFTYDVTGLVKTAAGAENEFAATVTSGWWSDMVAGLAGRKP